MKHNKGKYLPKIHNGELWFLYNALFLIEIYQPMKFQVDNFYSFCVMHGQTLSI